MKRNSFFWYVALSVLAVAAIGWSVWSTKAVAQVVASPLAPAVLPNPDRFTIELLKEYSAKQIEIENLLKRMRHEAKGETQRSELRQQIVEATAKQFDLRQQLREREIKQLRERLEQVESTVASRNKLKDEIVEKRVADILREPDQLQWEPIRIATVPNGEVTLAPPTVASPSYSIPEPPTMSYVPRTVTRIERETIVDENGNKQIVDKPVQETEYVEVGPPRTVPTPDGLANTRLASPSVSKAALSNQLQLAPNGLSVAEATARVRVAESKRENMLRRVFKGDADGDEVKTLTAELELAKVQLAQAQAEHEGRTKLLELDVRQAESVCEQAIAVLGDSQRINKSSPNTIPSTQVARQEATLEQARIDLERAKTLLDIHHKSNAPQVEGPQATR